MTLAIRGGKPVRATLLPYGAHWIDDDDIAAVTAALRSDWLTTGPRVDEFERAFAAVTGTRHAVAVSSGTAALHAALHVLDLAPGDEVIVPAITFVASANAVLYAGATPVFADVDPGTLLVTPETLEARRTPRTRAIVGVDYAGQPCDWSRIQTWARGHGIATVADACHAIGGADAGRPVGSLADLSTFSFHPVKAFTSGEGGAITTDDDERARRMRQFRNHGISTDHRQRQATGTWSYDMVELGFNYRLPDVACALATSQLAKLAGWIARRNAIAARYDRELPAAFAPLERRAGVVHGHHLYVVRLRLPRADVFAALRAEGIGANVHYRPVYQHPFYAKRVVASCPEAERAYEEILSLPIFPRMTDADVDDVIAAARKVAEAYA
jgi:perosamine synthetase